VLGEEDAHNSVNVLIFLSFLAPALAIHGWESSKQQVIVSQMLCRLLRRLLAACCLLLFPLQLDGAVVRCMKWWTTNVMIGELGKCCWTIVGKQISEWSNAVPSFKLKVAGYATSVSILAALFVIMGGSYSLRPFISPACCALGMCLSEVTIVLK
jgi:hypothetical protein